ncbi:MAG: hypothetical protein ACREL5_10445 [Gemmatimonadales bacterium]
MTPQGEPTVGDTLTIVRRVPAPPGAVVQAPAPSDSSIATLVVPPAITREGDSVRIAYTIAVWAPGHSDLVLPGAIVIDQHGRVDTLADAHVGLDVQSVLPAAKKPAAIAPAHPRTWVQGRDRSLVPFAFWIPLVLFAVAMLQWLWRRRGPPMPPPARLVPLPFTSARLEAWLAAGEPRLALEHLEHRLRERPDCEDWRRRAEAVRFAAGNDDEIAGLVHEALPLLGDEGTR